VKRALFVLEARGIQGVAPGSLYAIRETLEHVIAQAPGVASGLVGVGYDDGVLPPFELRRRPASARLSTVRSRYTLEQSFEQSYTALVG
jgi:hypothetical protein